jgi:hypothetical protein
MLAKVACRGNGFPALDGQRKGCSGGMGTRGLRIFRTLSNLSHVSGAEPHLISGL